MSSKTQSRIRVCLNVPCATSDCQGSNTEVKSCCLAPGKKLYTISMLMYTFVILVITPTKIHFMHISNRVYVNTIDDR